MKWPTRDAHDYIFMEKEVTTEYTKGFLDSVDACKESMPNIDVIRAYITILRNDEHSVHHCTDLMDDCVVTKVAYVLHNLLTGKEEK